MRQHPGTFAPAWCELSSARRKLPGLGSLLSLQLLYLRTRTRNQSALSELCLQTTGEIIATHEAFFLACMLRKITSKFSACTWPMNSRKIEKKVRGWRRVAVEAADTVKYAASLRFLASNLFWGNPLDPRELFMQRCTSSALLEGLVHRHGKCDVLTDDLNCTTNTVLTTASFLETKINTCTCCIQ